MPASLRRFLLGAAAVAISASSSSSASATPFTEGNIVILRLGSGSAPLNPAVTVPIFLDEYSLNGGQNNVPTLVRSVPIPADLAGAGGVEPAGCCAAQGGYGGRWSATLAPANITLDYSGQLEMAVDGQSVVFAAYNVSAGALATDSTSPSVSRVIVRAFRDGSISAPAFVNGVPWQTYAVASDDGSSRFWVASGTYGAYYIPVINVNVTNGTYTGNGSSTVTTVFTNPYRSVMIMNNQLYTSRPNSQIQVFAGGLPTTTAADDTALGSGAAVTFSDTRGLSYKSFSEIFIPDRGQGLAKIYRWGPGWNRLNVWKAGSAGNISNFLDTAISATTDGLYVITDDELYAFNTTSNAWYNGGKPLLKAAQYTTWRGLAFAPKPLPSPSPTASPSATPTPSRTPSTTSTVSSSPSATPSRTPRPSTDLAAAIRAAMETSSDPVAPIAGGIVGGILLIAGVAYGVHAAKQRKLQAARLRKLRASAELARLGGPTKYLGGLGNSAMLSEEDVEAEAELASRMGVGGVPPSSSGMVVYEMGPANAKLQASARAASGPGSASSLTSKRGLTGSAQAYAPQPVQSAPVQPQQQQHSTNLTGRPTASGRGLTGAPTGRGGAPTGRGAR